MEHPGRQLKAAVAVALSPLHTMMVTQTEAEQVAKRTGGDVKSIAPSRRMIFDALAKAELLEPAERRLAVVELATTVWLKSLASKGPTYSGFEPFLRAYFSEMSDVENYIYPLLVDDIFDSDAKAIYGEYLRGMLEASEKTRFQFYENMCAELSLQGSLETADFGRKASDFFRKVMGTLHEEHLLVAYSVRLFLKALMARQPSDSATIPDQDQEVIYRHFENSFPLCGKFMKYAKDDNFFNSCLDNGILSEIK